MAKDLAIVLNSGSVNSAVATALAAQRYRPVLVHVETILEAPGRSKAAYDQQVAHFKPYREHTLAMPQLAALEFETSPRSAGSADPRATTPLAPLLLHLLPIVSAAARIAGHYSAASIFLGLRVGGSPDELAQATEYIQIYNELLQSPCGLPDTEIQVPLLELEPWQVVDLGYQINAPLDRTWSCVEESADPCWACRGCRAREAAFQQSGKPDPMRAIRKL